MATKSRGELLRHCSVLESGFEGRREHDRVNKVMYGLENNVWFTAQALVFPSLGTRRMAAHLKLANEFL